VLGVYKSRLYLHKHIKRHCAVSLNSRVFSRKLTIANSTAQSPTQDGRQLRLSLAKMTLKSLLLRACALLPLLAATVYAQKNGSMSIGFVRPLPS
jgi:hypothetical protein